MVIRRKIEKAINEVDLDSVISKGGKTAAESVAVLDQDEEKKFTLRISEKMLNRIDAQCKKRIGNVSRNTWILETIEKSLAKEER